MATEETVQKILEKTINDGSKISNIQIKQYLANQNHYGQIVCVTAELMKDTGDKKELNLIAKTLPDNFDHMKASFTKEVMVYKLIIPEYIKLEEELNIDENLRLNIFPKYYGANDFDGLNKMNIFLLEDLNANGYTLAQSMKDLDMEHTKLVIDELAHFHALGIALKQKNPKIFHENFKHIIKPALQNDNISDKDKINLEFLQNVKNLIINNESLNPFYERVEKLLKIINDKPIPESKEPFATFLHNDLWKDNLLFEYKFMKNLSNLKLIDFQYCIYNSPIRDLVHYIYSSTSKDVQNNFKYLSNFYYEHLLNYLKILKCNYKQFTIELFNEEIKIFGSSKLKHLIKFILMITERTNDNPEEKLYNIFSGFENNGWL